MYQPTLDIDLNAVRQRHPVDPDGYLPAWVADQLQANKPNSARRLAAYHHCHKCQAIVLTGLDHDVAAFTATVDPTPLDPRLELAAVLTGRRTYAAWPAAGGYHLEVRDEVTMEDHTHPALPAHRCGARFPGFLEPPTDGRHNDWDKSAEPAF